MLQGLYSLSDRELSAFMTETGKKSSGPRRDTMLRDLISWMAEVVRCSADDPAQLEQTVLRWLAKRIDLDLPEATPSDEVEAAVRRKIAEESSSLLFPFLEVGSAVAFLGPAQVVGPKMELLEASTATLIPSHSARERLLQHWKSRGAKLLARQGQLTPDEVLRTLREPIQVLQKRDEATKVSVLILAYVVALSDGRYEGEEEIFVGQLAAELGVDAAKVNELRTQVTQIFWNQMNALGGATYQARNTEEELLLNLRAAQLTLEMSGGLASFSDEVEQGFVSSIHRSLQKDSAIRRGLSKGVKSPLSFPLGFATGMLCYIRERWSTDSQELLMRLSLAAIFRQHLEATGENVELTSERIEGYLPERKVENPADILKKTQVGDDTVHHQVRRIVLDP